MSQPRRAGTVWDHVLCQVLSGPVSPGVPDAVPAIAHTCHQSSAKHPAPDVARKFCVSVMNDEQLVDTAIY